MLTLLIVLLGILDLFIGIYLITHQKTNVLGLKITDNPRLGAFCRSYGRIFLTFGIIIIIFNFTSLAIIAIGFVIISMLATLGLTWQFSTFLKSMH